MKIEKKADFHPITITLETAEDLEAFSELVQLPVRPGVAREMWFKFNNFIKWNQLLGS